jgi:hypothetical protein
VKHLHIAPGMTLPIDAVTQTMAIIARRGAGKTHTAVVMAEEMLKAHLQVVVLDPLGVWWGLRSSFDGKSKGFPVVVFGGDHGDVPLTENMGAHVADVIVSRTISAVIDLSTLSKSAARRFGTAFAERLYEVKQPQDKHTPLHLFVDEADLFMPQRVQPDQARMLSAFEMFPRRGRNRGFGVTVITQRPATINKDVLTQAEVLITLQITGTQDRKAVLEWVEGHDDGNHRDEFLKSLAGLQRGQAWVWSPAWLDVFKLVQIRQRETYNSSATPTAGQVIKAPKELAPVDLERLRADMAAVLQEAEKNDPAKLKARILELERALKAVPKVTQGHIRPDELMKACKSVEAKIATKLKSWLHGQRKELKDSLDAVVLSYMEAADETLWQAIASIHAMSKAEAAAGPKTITAYMGQPIYRPSGALPRPHKGPMSALPKEQGGPGYGEMGKGERKILAALAQAGKPRTAAYVGVVTDYSSTSGTFTTYISRLRTKGYIDGPSSALVATDAGLAALGEYEALPSGRDLIDYWLNRLPKGEAAILRIAVDKYPDAVPAAYVGQETNYSHTSGTFTTYVSRLRTKCLLEGRGDIKASAELMGDS